ncbi:MAG: hypothetical protein DYG97_16530 [Ignavibacteria bacterium CHB3]|nr:hypothetical protein [Ignavibacteria bacterium CHB3]
MFYLCIRIKLLFFGHKLKIHSNHPVISVDEIVRPTRVEVDLKILAENFKAIKTHVGNTKVMPVLKANAYGHGLVRIAQLYEDRFRWCVGKSDSIIFKKQSCNNSLFNR